MSLTRCFFNAIHGKQSSKISELTEKKLFDIKINFKTRKLNLPTLKLFFDRDLKSYSLCRVTCSRCNSVYDNQTSHIVTKILER